LPERLLQALAEASPEWRPLARQLHAQRLAPLAGHLDGVRQLVVLPSAAMDGVPVEAIADGFVVRYALSPSLFADQRRRQPPATADAPAPPAGGAPPPPRSPHPPAGRTRRCRPEAFC